MTQTIEPCIVLNRCWKGMFHGYALIPSNIKGAPAQKFTDPTLRYAEDTVVSTLKADALLHGYPLPDNIEIRRTY